MHRRMNGSMQVPRCGKREVEYWKRVILSSTVYLSSCLQHSCTKRLPRGSIGDSCGEMHVSDFVQTYERFHTANYAKFMKEAVPLHPVPVKQDQLKQDFQVQLRIAFALNNLLPEECQAVRAV